MAPAYNSGVPNSTATSIRHGEAMAAIRRALEGRAFPMPLDRLLAEAGDLELPTAGGERLPLRDLLRDVHVEEFTSADHVAEVARLAWSLPTEIFPPEGGG